MSKQSVGTGHAVWFTAARCAELREEEIKAPGRHDIQVRALQSLVSAGSELNLYRGEGNLPSLDIIAAAAGELPFPVKFAYQVVGRVEIAGADSGYKSGDYVFVAHPHQNVFTIAASSGAIFKLPGSVSLDRAAFLALFSTALHVHLVEPVRMGSCAVVSGLGVIGVFTAWIARRTAGKLILIDPLAERRSRAEWIGADAVVSPVDAQRAILECSGGRGADIFYETSGAPAALQTAIRSTGNLGTIAVAAWYGTRSVSLTLSPEFHLKGHKIVSIWVGQLGGDLAARWDRERKMNVALSCLGQIDVTPLITQRIPFMQAANAYRLIDTHPEQTLGVILDYGAI